jgi:hypothetical protein
MPFTMATRSLPVGLLAATLCGGCGGSAVQGDGGVDRAVDHVSDNLLIGSVDPSAGVPTCITAPLMLVGGQAQCTVVQHLAVDGGVTSTTLQSCAVAASGPCWSLISSPSSCPNGVLSFTFEADPANPNPNPNTLSYDYSCALSN